MQARQTRVEGEIELNYLLFTENQQFQENMTKYEGRKMVGRYAWVGGSVETSLVCLCFELVLFRK